LPQAKIKILGPSKVRLDALKKWWISEIRRMGIVGALEDLEDVFEFVLAHEVPDAGQQLLSTSDADLAAAYFPDNSVTNGSSISLIVEVEDRRLLFLGDSRADDIVAALAPNGRMIFDAVKIAHHGSLRNTSPELLTLVDSPHFFISTNGDGHSHPNFAVLKAIVDRPAAFRRTLHF
jgi:beta-lactamase superfamily II metal-dependent hydrolase